MSETTFVTDYTDYTGPEGLRTRGTVLVVPGRGESEATYRRFGRRLAADSSRAGGAAAPVVGPAALAQTPAPPRWPRWWHDRCRGQEHRTCPGGRRRSCWRRCPDTRRTSPA